MIAAAAQAGYGTAGTLPGRITPGGALDWPRIGVYHADADWRFALKISRRVRWLRASPAWDALGGGAAAVRPLTALRRPTARGAAASR